MDSGLTISCNAPAQVVGADHDSVAAGRGYFRGMPRASNQRERAEADSAVKE